LSDISQLKFPFKLKKDQIEAVDAWLNNNSRGSIIYSTGTGKTEIALECAKRIAENGVSNFKILFLVPRIVLLEQNVKRLTQYGIKKDKIGVYYGEKKNVKEITLSTYQSILKNFALLKNANMVILDEVHLVSTTAKKFSSIFSILELDIDKAILGLTATIDEEDPRYSKIMTLIPPVRKYMIKEAVNDGRLTEPRIIIKSVRLNLKDKDNYEKISKAIREISLKLRSSNPNEISWFLKSGGIKSKLASEWFSYVQERKKLLNETLSKLNETISIFKQNPNERIMVFI
jgi:superfamily II DNA or RNA helicase